MAESAKVVASAMQSGIQPYAFLMQRKHIEGQAKQVLALSGDEVHIYTGDDELLNEIVGYQPYRCIQCLMRRPAERSLDEVCGNAERIAVIEDVSDSTNLGAIIRSAAALGIDAAILSPGCCDPYNRRSIRVSMGTVFTLPWSRACENARQWGTHGLKALHEMGFVTVALALRDDSLHIDDPALTHIKKLALVLGAEGDGLAPSTIAACTYSAKIPMRQGVDSLNVAAAGAVAFWQLRKR